jgi:hypothetical protein
MSHSLSTQKSHTKKACEQPVSGTLYDWNDMAAVVVGKRAAYGPLPARAAEPRAARSPALGAEYVMDRRRGGCLIIGKMRVRVFLWEK